MIRQIVQDFAVLEDNKIIQDDDKFLVVKTVIASEIVHKYQRGIAYKPAYPTNFSPGLNFVLWKNVLWRTSDA